MQSGRLIRCLPWFSAALLAVSCAAQVMQQPGTMPGQDPAGQRPGQGSGQDSSHASQPPAAAAPDVHVGAISSNAAGPAADSPALPPSLMDKPAQPARITLRDGLLTIKADNSSLSAILQHLSSTDGMSVDGFQKDQRVFGIYGPGNPRDVLSGLLQDAGYNFLIVGTTDKGIPKEIVLTANSGAAGATSGPAQMEPEAQPDEDDNDNNSNNFPPEPPMPERTAPPGAAVAPPNGQVKTPAEIIQELQRLRQQQQNPQ